jgi:hypothetical protein
MDEIISLTLASSGHSLPASWIIWIWLAHSGHHNLNIQHHGDSLLRASPWAREDGSVREGRQGVLDVDTPGALWYGGWWEIEGHHMVIIPPQPWSPPRHKPYKQPPVSAPFSEKSIMQAVRGRCVNQIGILQINRAWLIKRHPHIQQAGSSSAVARLNS